MPGTPMPTPSSPCAGIPVRSSTSAMPSRRYRTTTSTSYRSTRRGPSVASGFSTRASSVSARSNSSTRTRVSPTSMPIMWPLCGLTRSRVRGRPPTESTLPASSTSPSAISSETTLLTDPELRPVAGPSENRLSGPSKYSRCSTAVRFSRRRSRTVRPLRSVTPAPSFSRPRRNHLGRGS